jgi:hypothetical protein
MQKIDGIGAEALAKVQASRNESIPEQMTMILFNREIRPCVDIRINLRQLIDQETLKQDPSLRGERVAKRLFLPSTEKVPDQCATVYLRILPQSDHINYELVDPLATDLQRCDYLFSQIEGLENRVGILQELAAPSFSGKQAIAVVRNVMALGDLDENENGTTDEFLAIQRAIQYISRQPLQQVRLVYKELTDVMMKRFHLSEMDLLTGITIEDLMDSAGSTEQAWILDELIGGSLKHLSALLVQHLNKQPVPSSNELYELFMLCKYIVKTRTAFALNI